MPKTEAGNRRIPMMQQVYDVLQEEYDRQKQEGFCTENVDGMTNFVFTLVIFSDTHLHLGFAKMKPTSK